MGKLVFDVETSRFPDGSAYRQSAKIISWASQYEDDEIIFAYYTDPDFVSKLQEQLDKATLLIGINLKYDISWLRRIGCRLPKGIRVWDQQSGEFILSGQTRSFASMDDLCGLYGIEGKAGGLEEWWGQNIETADIPRNIVEAYNVGDIQRTSSIYSAQQLDTRLTPNLRQLILLAGADLLVLQQMEQNGILYDKAGSITAGDTAQKEIEELKRDLQSVIDFEHFNLDSGDDLSCFLYGGVVTRELYAPVGLVYKSGERKGMAYTQNKHVGTATKKFEGLFKPLPKTALKKEGYFQTGEPVLRQLPTRTKEQKLVIHRLLRLAELSKQVGSFLHALPELLEKSGWGDTIHPTYNQVVARTGRLSCSKPNAQQFPEIVDQFWVSRYA